MVLYSMYGAKLGYENVRIKSPDSDIFFILLHHAFEIKSNILFDTGSGNKKRLINVSKKARELGQSQCSALLSLHGLTGCDTASSFKSIGKVKPLKVLKKFPKIENSLSNLGESWDMETQHVNEIEHFICSVYGFPRFKKIDELRFHILQRKCENNGQLDATKNIDLANIPPCSSSLKQHLKRSNYQVKIWKLAIENFPEIPDPSQHGWKMGGVSMEPIWSEEKILPVQLVDLLEEVGENESEEEVIDYDSDSSNSSDVL